MLRLRAGANHLGEKIDVIVRLTRHRFANLMQDGQEFWATIHAKYKFEFEVQDSG